VVLDILVLLVIIAPAALIHYRAGLWAAILGLWAALVAGAVAFGFYLPVSALLFRAGPEANSYYWGQGATMLVLFIVTFGLVRLVFEQFLRNTMTFRPLIDTIAGPVVGALGGYVLGGVLAVFAQMMPLPPKVLGYEPFSVGSPTSVRKAKMGLRCDDAVLGIYNGLSRGALAGGEHGLAGRYRASEPLKSVKAEGHRRGRTAEDILYDLFCRRVQYALLKNPSAHYGGKGVSLNKVGETSTFTAGRGQAAMEMKIENVWLTPALTWTDPSRRQVVIGPDDIPWDGPPEEGARRRSAAASRAGEGLLVIDVSFRPKKDEAQNVLLKDWELDSVFKDKKGSWSTRQVKLLLEGTTQGAEISPVSSEKLRKDELPVIDLETVARQIELPAEGNRNWTGSGKTMVLSGDANWVFAGNSRWARAVLVYSVPSLSQPWQYGLKCAPEDIVDESAGGRGAKPEGLTRGRKIDLASLRVEVLEAGLLSRLNSRLALEAETGNQWMQVRLRISPMTGRDAPKQLLLKSGDLRVAGPVAGAEYETLLHEMLTLKDDQVSSDTLLRRADMESVEVETIAPEDEQPGERLGKDWEIYFETSGGTVECRLVFQAPRGRPLHQYDVKQVAQPSEESPDWYLRKNAAAMSTRSHDVVVVESPVVESISLMSQRGEPRPFQPAQGGGQQLVVVKASLQPRKDDDRNFYSFDPTEAKLQLSRRVSPQPLQLFAVRVPGAEHFAPVRLAEPITIRDIAVIEFVFLVSQNREGAMLVVPGGRPVPIGE
jgi:uncharacterized membrane protein required for colicin V production